MSCHAAWLYHTDMLQHSSVVGFSKHSSPQTLLQMSERMVQRIPNCSLLAPYFCLRSWNCVVCNYDRCVKISFLPGEADNCSSSFVFKWLVCITKYKLSYPTYSFLRKAKVAIFLLLQAWSLVARSIHNVCWTWLYICMYVVRCSYTEEKSIAKKTIICKQSKLM